MEAPLEWAQRNAVTTSSKAAGNGDSETNRAHYQATAVHINRECASTARALAV